MSTHTRPKAPDELDDPSGVRFRPRDEPPDRLYGPPKVNYPAKDGRPMADNTLQFEWISRIKGGLDIVFRDDPRVFVAGNILWYPVKGNNRRRLAPDALVVFGRPKGYRSSYVQHRERGIPPQVVFEVLSPSNGRRVREFKLKIYGQYGVEEYYEFDPYKIELNGWLRNGESLRPIVETSGWVSPRLGIRFDLAEDLTIYGPDGRPFEDHVEISLERDESNQAAREAADRAEAERLRADAEQLRADAEQLRAETERLRADSEQGRAETERLRADSEQGRAERLAARLRALGLDPEE